MKTAILFFFLVAASVLGQPMQRNIMTTNLSVIGGGSTTVTANQGVVTISSTGGGGGGSQYLVTYLYPTNSFASVSNAWGTTSNLIFMSPGDYYNMSNIVPANNVTVHGEGAVMHFSKNCTNFLIDCFTNVVGLSVYGLRLAGDAGVNFATPKLMTNAPGQIGEYQPWFCGQVSGTYTNRSGIRLNAGGGGMIQGMTVDGFGAFGYFLGDTNGIDSWGGGQKMGFQNNRAFSNWCGIFVPADYLDWWQPGADSGPVTDTQYFNDEFQNLDECVCHANGIGLYSAAGNNRIIGGDFSGNQLGVYFGGGYNAGKELMTGAIIGHCTFGVMAFGVQISIQSSTVGATTNIVLDGCVGTMFNDNYLYGSAPAPLYITITNDTGNDTTTGTNYFIHNITDGIGWITNTELAAGEAAQSNYFIGNYSYRGLPNTSQGLGGSGVNSLQIQNQQGFIPLLSGLLTNNTLLLTNTTAPQTNVSGVQNYYPIYASGPTWICTNFFTNAACVDSGNPGATQIAGIAPVGKTNMILLYNSSIEMWDTNGGFRYASNYCVPAGFNNNPDPTFCGGKIIGTDFVAVVNQFNDPEEVASGYTTSTGTYLLWFTTNTLVLVGSNNLNNTTGINMEDFVVPTNGPYAGYAIFDFFAASAKQFSEGTRVGAPGTTWGTTNYLIYNTNTWTSNNYFGLQFPVVRAGGMDYNPLNESIYMCGVEDNEISPYYAITNLQAVKYLFTLYNSSSGGQGYYGDNTYLATVSLSNGIVTPIIQYYNASTNMQGQAGVAFFGGNYSNIVQLFNYDIPGGFSNNIESFSVEPYSYGGYDWESGISYRNNILANSMYANNIYGSNIFGTAPFLTYVGTAPNGLYGDGTYRDTAIGYEVMTSATTSAIYDTAFGNAALQNVTTGNGNTAIGVAALGHVTTGNGSTAIGSGALSDFTTGIYNIAIGNDAGDNFTGGESYNIDIGNTGNSGDQNTIRIGTAAYQNTTIIAGQIYGNGGGLTNLPSINIIGSYLALTGTAQTNLLASNSIAITDHGTNVLTLNTNSGLVIGGNLTASNLIAGINFSNAATGNPPTNCNMEATNLPYTNLLGTYALVTVITTNTTSGQFYMTFYHSNSTGFLMENPTIFMYDGQAIISSINLMLAPGDVVYPRMVGSAASGGIQTNYWTTNSAGLPLYWP